MSDERYDTIPAGDSELRAMALKRLQAKQNFYRHIAVYVLVNIIVWVLWAMNRSTTGDDGPIPWPAWVTFGWGIGILFQAAALFGPGNQAPSESAVEAEMQRMRRR